MSPSRPLAAIALLVAALVAWAAPAQAKAASFYYVKQCSVTPDGKARLRVSNWSLPGGGQRYHMDLNSRTSIIGPDWYQKAIYFNGTRLSGTNDVYKNVSSTYTVNTIKGTWTLGSGIPSTVSCTVRL